MCLSTLEKKWYSGMSACTSIIIKTKGNKIAHEI